MSTPDTAVTGGALATVRASTGLAIHGGPTVLGERQARIPTAGKIRPGIKVLTAAAAKNPKAVEAYTAGVAAGKPFNVVEQDIKRACGMKDDDRSPLTPKNVPYFTVRPGDFTMPEMAARLLELYGEDRGEGRHLYRFPAVFPVDSWQVVLPHALKAWSRAGLQFWSEYGSDGRRYCKTHQAVPMDEKSKRARRVFGGRPVVLRDWNNGLCDPEQCPEYQKSVCKLSGELLFYVPGLPGTSALTLPMTSFYAMQGIRQQLELMTYIRGRISGTNNGEPMFAIAKRLEEVSMIDPETGLSKRVKQWITVLEGRADMTRLLDAPEEEEPAGAVAVAALEGGVVIDGTAEQAEETGTQPEGLSLADAKAFIAERLRCLRLQWAAFEPYAERKWPGWLADLALATRVLDELDNVPDTGPERDEYVASVRREGA